ncbi:hypothetical protein FMEAI12_5290056 [Parafrankia sp. Ea1.12]|nr:hypothetical protein FMEAI12_5290056 [Parafrankia sp. Ea1.12]
MVLHSGQAGGAVRAGTGRHPIGSGSIYQTIGLYCKRPMVSSQETAGLYRVVQFEVGAAGGSCRPSSVAGRGSRLRARTLEPAQPSRVNSGARAPRVR